MDRDAAGVQYRRMRFFLPLLSLLALAACSGGPAALGITGPAPQIRPTNDEGARGGFQGEDVGQTVDPNYNPGTADTRFWRYN